MPTDPPRPTPDPDLVAARRHLWQEHTRAVDRHMLAKGYSRGLRAGWWHAPPEPIPVSEGEVREALEAGAGLIEAVTRRMRDEIHRQTAAAEQLWLNHLPAINRLPVAEVPPPIWDVLSAIDRRTERE